MGEFEHKEERDVTIEEKPGNIENKKEETTETTSEEYKEQEEKKDVPVETKEEPKVEKKERKPFNLNEFYNKNYKKLIILPFSLLILSIILIIFQAASTGDFINKDVSLKGGVTITIPLEKNVDIIQLKESLLSDFSDNDISVRSLKRGGKQIGVIISADIDGTNNEEINGLLTSIEKNLNIKMSEIDYTTEIVGSSLGASFFREILKVLIIAFLFMGLIVFLYFRLVVPSGAIILAAFSDIIITLAVVNFFGIKLSTAGIAAFLMLIGYAVDTNILLSTKLLKRKEGTINKRISGALMTGLTMTLTTLSAILIALIFTQSIVIRQIMTILLIGLVVDIINTWIQNASLLKWYLEKKQTIKDG